MRSSTKSPIWSSRKRPACRGLCLPACIGVRATATSPPISAMANRSTAGRHEEPPGRGPFTGPNAFVDGAVDAIKIEGWGSVIDWRLEKQLYYMLLFNGIGSELWGHPSSYVWGGSNIQQPGKWVRDHVWSATTWNRNPAARRCYKPSPTLIRQ